MQDVKAHNAKKDKTSEVELNQFADWTDNEFESINKLIVPVEDQVEQPPAESI